MNIKKIAFISAVFLLILLGLYLGFKRFLRDRQAAANYHGFDDRRIRQTVTTNNGKTTRTYTEKELEEAKKNGTLPKGAQPVAANQAQAANDAAVQRTLQTLQEINRINEMNQRLQEQQQRMQKQNK